MDTIRDVIHNTAPDVMSARYEDERRKHKAKLNKLVDLYVDGDVDRVVYEKKRKYLEYKINELTEKIDALAKYTNNDSKIEINLNKIRNSLKAREASNQIEEFDKIIFDSLVDYVIIGGMDENDEPNGFIIRYICKTGIYNKSRTDISETLILENGLNNTNDNIYVPILDFLSNQKFFTYEFVNGKRAKKYIDKVRVRLEIEK